VTNREKRTTFRIRSSSYDENKDDGGIELVSIRGLTMADTNIKF
jgi:hypothetical protein